MTKIKVEDFCKFLHSRSYSIDVQHMFSNKLTILDIHEINLPAKRLGAVMCPMWPCVVLGFAFMDILDVNFECQEVGEIIELGRVTYYCVLCSG